MPYHPLKGLAVGGHQGWIDHGDQDRGIGNLARVAAVPADNSIYPEPPLHTLVKRFHQLDLAGATVYRGMEGYGASGRIHRNPVFRSGDEPVTVVAVDSAEKIERALPYLDQMVGSGLVAISDVDVILYRETAGAAR